MIRLRFRFAWNRSASTATIGSRAFRSYRSTSIEIGNASIAIVRPWNFSFLSEPVASVKRLAAREKFRAARMVWNPITSAPSIPSRICCLHGIFANSSSGGNGMCRKKPIRDFGSRSRTRPGTSCNW